MMEGILNNLITFTKLGLIGCVVLFFSNFTANAAIITNGSVLLDANDANQLQLWLGEGEIKHYQHILKSR